MKPGRLFRHSWFGKQSKTWWGQLDLEVAFPILFGEVSCSCQEVKLTNERLENTFLCKNGCMTYFFVATGCVYHRLSTARAQHNAKKKRFAREWCRLAAFIRQAQYHHLGDEVEAPHYQGSTMPTTQRLTSCPPPANKPMYACGSSHDGSA